MILKKLGAALLATVALSALFASVSQAQIWEVGTTKFTSGQTEAVKTEQIGTAKFTSTVLGETLELTGTGVEAIEGKLTQTGTGATGVAGATGKLKFTGVTVMLPVGCVSATSIETTALTAVAAMGNTVATENSVYVKFTPTSGTVFATIKLTECAAAGSYQVKGNLYAKAVNATGVLGKAQRIDSSGAINESQGGALTLGTNVATLEGSINVLLNGGNVNGEWRLTKE
jgi:hypothetical protein